MSKTRPHDNEIVTMTKIVQLLATMPPGARRRVYAYVGARLESLPVVAAVGGGIEDEAHPSMFPDPRDDVPQMPAEFGRH